MSAFSFTPAVVTSIGAAEVRADKAAEYVVSVTSDTYDWSARGAVPAAIRAALGVDKDNEPRQKTGPKGDQKTTNYGRGFDTLSKRVTALVKGDTGEKPVVLRASLSGEGGGSVTIPADHPMYEALVALITGDKPDTETVTVTPALSVA